VTDFNVTGKPDLIAANSLSNTMPLEHHYDVGEYYSHSEPAKCQTMGWSMLPALVTEVCLPGELGCNLGPSKLTE
jgi:hypothetical protein